jgi:hypothetical protein
MGCQQSSGLKGLAPASGTVTFNDAPVAQAMIIFSPKPGENNCRSASATTDSNGKFSMMTLQPGDGVFPASYIVTVEKTEITGDSRFDPVRKIPIDERQIVDLLPVKYNNTETSDLSVTISPQGNKSLEFKLIGEVNSKPRKLYKK